MLGPGRYLLGVLEILLLGGFAWLGGTALRGWLLPRFEGAPAYLATAVLALALLIWPAELLGTFSVFHQLPYLVLVGAAGIGIWVSSPRPPGGGGSHLTQQVEVGTPSPRHEARFREGVVPTVVALLVAAIAAIHFAGGVKTRLSTGMTGFDSTWYHGPFAAGFFQGGDTWDLHLIAPQFLAWFYPANGEIFHAVGMLAFSRDLLSPLLNLGWFLGCLVACWCIGRPYRVAPWSLVLGAIALSVPALADQAGEARNDIVGIFFLLAAVALTLNAVAGDDASPAGGAGVGDPHSAGRGASEHMGVTPATGPAGWSTLVGPCLIIGLAAGLAAGTKLNFLPPAAVLVVGLALVAPGTTRWRALAAMSIAALAGGGYWYLRNLAHTGNPLPWIHHLGPIDPPAPEQALGGREAHSVLGYLSDGAVWTDWFLPGLHHGLWLFWPLLLVAALTGLLLCLRGPTILRVAGIVGLATVVSWLIAPTSASGPDGMPRGFESGLRYLVPALVLGLALLPTVPFIRSRIAVWKDRAPRLCRIAVQKRGAPFSGRDGLLLWGGLIFAVGIAIGYPVQRHYLESRYEAPAFSAPGLDAAFAWARDVSDARIATTSTRQYPLFGADLSNHVRFLGLERPHGGFEAPRTCPAFRRLLNEGHYDYVITTRDRLEPGKPPYPPQAHWTEASGARVILKKPPTVVFRLSEPLDPSACR